MKNKNMLNKIALGLIISGLSFTTFAASEVKNEKEELSKIRISIQKEKLNQEYEQEKLNKLRIQQEQSKIENNNSIGLGAVKIDEMSPTEEARIAKDNNIPQNVGFIYKNDSSENKSNKVLNELNGEMKDSSPEELSKVLQKFDELKKESDSAVKETGKYVVVKTLVSTDLDMLSIYDGNKNAKVRFSYIHDDGIQKKKVITVVNVTDGKTFKVDDDIYNVINLDSDGLVIVNTKTKEEIILTKNN